MKNYISIGLFVIICLLCAAETFPKFIKSAQKKSGTVMYVRGGLDPDSVQKKENPEPKDYNKLIQGIDVKGA